MEFSLGAENATTVGSATAGIGAGKVKFNSLVIKKAVDRTSPTLFQALAMGSHYPTMTLSVRKTGGAKGSPFYMLKFAMVFVTKITVSSGDEQPTEEITLSYGAVEETYTPTDPTTGATDPAKAVRGTWNQVTNKPDLAVP